MIRILLYISYYIAAIFLIRHIHAWSPTNMAGLGLDIVVYFLVPLISTVLLAQSLRKRKSGDRWSRGVTLIHFLGITLLALSVYQA